MATLKYWLWLTTRKGMADAGALSLLEYFGTPEAAYFADPGEYDMVPGLSGAARSALLDKSLDGAMAIMDDCERLGQRIMTFSDADYPERLRNIYDPPVVLYLRGKGIHFDEEVAIGLVGTREPSSYGTLQAHQLGRDLAAQGAVVVSGLARGLDSEGIKGALRAGGTVCGVLGGGVDVIYPRENRYLFEDVAAAGLLISEYPPGTETRAGHFPVRNRIISGLSLGVVVVEGAAGSGTRITARAALEQNRDVFAVPGPVDAPMSFTPNDLIHRGEAQLITSAADILKEYLPIFPHKIRLKPGLERVAPAIVPGPVPRSRVPEGERRQGEPEEKKEVDNPAKVPYIHWKDLSPTPTDDQRDILLALGERDMTMDEIIEVTQIPARRATSAVTMLQLSGFVNEGPGKRFSAAVRVRGD